MSTDNLDIQQSNPSGKWAPSIRRWLNRVAVMPQSICLAMEKSWLWSGQSSWSQRCTRDPRPQHLWAAGLRWHWGSQTSEEMVHKKTPCTPGFLWIVLLLLFCNRPMKETGSYLQLSILQMKPWMPLTIAANQSMALPCVRTGIPFLSSSPHRHVYSILESASLRTRRLP